MSTEFNYKRAWDEYIKPAFQAIYPSIKDAYEALKKDVDTIHQIGASAVCSGVTKDLQEKFDKIDSDTLAIASETVYYYGHLASNKEAQEGGLYWKFKDIAVQTLISRKDDSLELLHRERILKEKSLNSFYDHKEGTEYDNEEIPGLLKPVPNVTSLKADNVNHKPDIFCIGLKHMRLSTGMFLDPAVAPCYNCGRPYREHKSDRVLFVQLDTEDQELIKTVLLNLKQQLEELKIKIDGFVLVK